MFLRRLFLLLALAIPFTLGHAADPSPLSDGDLTFIKKATIAGLMEVQASEAALKRTLTPEESAFTKQLISDHQKMTDELVSIAKRKGVTAPTAVPADEQAKLTKMAEIKDKDFNEEFLEHQITCHKKAIDLFEDEADDGKDADLKAFASRTLPTLKAHLDTAKQLEAKY